MKAESLLWAASTAATAKVTNASFKSSPGPLQTTLLAYMIHQKEQARKWRRLYSSQLFAELRSTLYSVYILVFASTVVSFLKFVFQKVTDRIEAEDTKLKPKGDNNKKLRFETKLLLVLADKESCNLK